MSAIDYMDTVRYKVTLRNPFAVESLPFMSRLHRFAFRHRSRGLAKRLVGKPAKWLYGSLMAAGFGGKGLVRVETPNGTKHVSFNARNTQFSALYMPYCLPVYEAEVTVLLDRLVGEHDVFFDIGANWGWHSMMLATRPSFAGRIHAFEPFPPTFADLDKMVKDTGMEPRIRCHAVALAESDGETTMALPDGLHSGLAQLDATGSIKVARARLDHLDLPAPNVLKIDVEDHELGVLRGASGVIEKARPFIVMENPLHPGEPQRTLDPIMHLVQAGYNLFYPGWTGGDPDCILGADRFVPKDGDELALVPFLPIHRFQLAPLINIVACPNERTDEFRARFEGTAPPVSQLARRTA